jgi:amino acid adenylation domain-containing protein
VHNYKQQQDEGAATGDSSFGPAVVMSPAQNLAIRMSDRTELETATPFLIELQALQTPEALAVSHGENRLTYRQLLECSNAVAQQLMELGLERGGTVGIYSERSVAAVVSALGIMRAGGAYVPLDPSYPQERLAFQLKDSGADILMVSGRPVADELSALASHVLRCAANGKLEGPIAPRTRFPEVSGDDLAYVIYTSGSSGRPKGVEITHSGLLNMIRWYQSALQVTSNDRFSHVAAVGFDATVWELWPACVTGASVHIADNATVTDLNELQAWLTRERVTISFIPTPLAERLMAKPWPPTALRIMMTGGDTLHSYPPPTLPFQVVNNYGPTECTILATSAVLPADPELAGLPPIGRPITNVQVYIVDAALRQVPKGEVGEIWIGGRGVGRGYRNLPDLTADSFVPNIFEAQFGSRLYRTGDLGCYLPDGQIAFKGRLDQQIKIRGVRIEPGEVEVALNGHEAIQESVVVARRFGSGDKRLLAYVVLNSQPAPSVRDLRDFLGKRLPSPMIPSVFVVLDHFPFNASGKIDRLSLPAPMEGNMLSAGDITAPRDMLEQRLQQIWEDLLEIDIIGVQQDFFELGGDSLLALRLLTEVENALSFNLPLSALLEARTIEDLARVIRHQGLGSDWSSLIAVQPLGSKPPLFCVHSHTGDVMYCEYVARGAGPDQPIYGLQSQAVAGKPPHFSTEEMADCYVSELRKIQPRGPYHLFGFCFGGMVAYEMARRLITEGESVAYLGIYNAPAPGTLKGWPLGQVSYLMKRTRNEWAKLSTLGLKEGVQHILKNARNFGRMIQRSLRVDGWRAWAGLRGNQSSRETGKKLLSLEEINIAAAKSFHPIYVFPGRIILYLSPEIANVYPISPEAGWTKFAAEGVDKIYVPLDKMAWRGTPFVETVGGSLKRFIPSPRALTAAGSKS